MAGIVALTEMPEAAADARFEEGTESGGTAIDVRRKLEDWGEAAVTVLTDDVSEGLRERFCTC